MCLFVNNIELFFYELKKELQKEYNYLLSEFCQTATFFIHEKADLKLFQKKLEFLYLKFKEIFNIYLIMNIYTWVTMMEEINSHPNQNKLYFRN